VRRLGATYAHAGYERWFRIIGGPYRRGKVTLYTVCRIEEDHEPEEAFGTYFVRRTTQAYRLPDFYYLLDNPDLAVTAKAHSVSDHSVPGDRLLALVERINHAPVPLIPDRRESLVSDPDTERYGIAFVGAGPVFTVSLNWTAGRPAYAPLTDAVRELVDFLEACCSSTHED
jgi:hypothetical protein